MNVYPIDAHNNPLTTRGIVHAAQRGSAAGLLYFSITTPAVGSILYFQNLTALNDYCEQTHTTPNTVVGQSWPGLGFLIPDTEDKPLVTGKVIGISDAFVHLSEAIPKDPQQSAKLFMEMLASVYTELPRPDTQYHDWPKMARATRRDLDHSRKLRIEEQGYLYLHPYTAAEYPDSMVQLTVLVPLTEFADWSGEKSATATRLRDAFPNFFDPKLGTIRRYLSTVGEDKKADEVDSWYLCHPLDESRAPRETRRLRSENPISYLARFRHQGRPTLQVSLAGEIQPEDAGDHHRQSKGGRRRTNRRRRHLRERAARRVGDHGGSKLSGRSEEGD